MRVFVIHTDGHPTLMVSLERQLEEFLNRMDVPGTASWYYDEFSDNESGTEYGVRLDVSLTHILWRDFLDEVFEFCHSYYGDTIKIQEA